jgi:predicted molibdopterin-dependent oxidoreductase YjgC
VEHRLYEAIHHLVKDRDGQLQGNIAEFDFLGKNVNTSNAFANWAAQMSSANTTGLAWKLTSKTCLSPEQDVEVDEWVYSTCGYCASGCGLYIGVKNGQAVAVKGNRDYSVNSGSVSCIKGLYQWKSLHHPDRLTQPLVRKNGALKPVSWEEALELVAAKIKTTLIELGPEGLGFYGSGQLLLEESYGLAKLAKGVIGTPNIDSNLRLCTVSGVYANLQSFGSDGPTGCFNDLDEAQGIFIFGCNPAEMHPAVWQRVLRNRRTNGAKLIVADPRKILPAEIADIHLQLRAGTNLALLNGLLHILIKENWVNQQFIENHTAGFNSLKETIQAATPQATAAITGIPEDLIHSAARLLGQAESFVTVFVQGVFQSHLGAEAAATINNLHLVTGNIGRPGASPFSLTGQCASMSHREVGGSSTLPGYRSHSNEEHRGEVSRYWGISAGVIPDKTNDIFHMLQQIEEGRLPVLWNIATNPAVSLPKLAYVRRQLAKVFLIVQDIYPNETQSYADVVLPAAQWGEKTGTYTNAERRVNLGRKAVNPPGQAKPDLEIFCMVAEKLGAGQLFSWRNTEEAFQEWKGLSKDRPNDMTGITYDRLEQELGIQWPCSEKKPAGTDRLYVDGHFSHEDGKARLICYKYLETGEKTSEEFPFLLNTGRLPEHYHTRVKTKRIPELHQMSNRGFVEINFQDAEKLSIKEGELVKVISPRGEIQVEAKVSESVLTGHVFIPFHFGDDINTTASAVNHLTDIHLNQFSRQPVLKTSICRIEKQMNQINTANST